METCTIVENQQHIAYMDPRPTTSGVVIVQVNDPNTKGSIFRLSYPRFAALLRETKRIAQAVVAVYQVERCALLSDTHKAQITAVKIVPLYGLSAEWKAIVSENTEFYEYYPGFTTSCNGPRMANERLNEIQAKIRRHLVDQQQSFLFDGPSSDSNLFARLVRGELEQWRIWESETHIAWLTPFANTPGFTVVVPRRHLSSNIFSLDDDDYEALLAAIWEVEKLIEKGMSVPTCALVFEGYEIDYAHAKLIPVNPVDNGTETSVAKNTVYHRQYEGFITSLCGPDADIENLQKQTMDIVNFFRLHINN